MIILDGNSDGPAFSKVYQGVCDPVCCVVFAVPEEQRARVVLQLGGGRVHATDTVFRRCVEAGVSGPGNLEAVHEALCQNHCQGANRIRRHRQARIPRAPQGGEDSKLPMWVGGLCTPLTTLPLFAGVHPHEQHTAAARAAREDVRVDGR